MVEPVDAGGVGIHKITQDETANDELAGKKSKKAWAKALMKLAPAAYRAGVLELEATVEYNESIVSLVNAEYEGLPGLELLPAEGMVDVCTVQGDSFLCVPRTTPWVCHGIPDVYLVRMTLEEAPCEEAP